MEHDALDGSIGSPSSHTSTACPADDDARDDDPSDGSDEDDTTMMESKMNVEVAAMLLTPLDLDTHRASQCQYVANEALSAIYIVCCIHLGFFLGGG